MNSYQSHANPTPQTSSSTLWLIEHGYDERPGVSRIPTISRTFSLGEAFNHWICIDGEEHLEVDGAMYVVHDCVRNGYNRVTLLLSPASYLTRSEISQILGFSRYLRARRNGQRGLLRRFRTRVMELFGRTRH